MTPPSARFNRRASAAWRVVAACLCGGCLLCASAYAQGAAYCNITRISAKRLPNAVQVTIQADGVMRASTKMEDFINMDALQSGRYEDAPKLVSSLPFRITNARSKVNSFTDIGIYPVSHVEVSAPPDAPEGIGLDLRVALFAPAVVESVQMPEGPDFTDPSRKGSIASMQMTPDKMSIIILVVSDRRIPPPVVLRTASAGAPVQLDVTAQDGNVSIHALNADLKTMLRRVAAAAGRQIVLDGSTDHTVSLWLDGVPLDQALESVAIAYGLSVDAAGPILRFSDANVRSVPAYGQTAMTIIPVHNMTATAVRDSLPVFLLRYIMADTQRNTLTVSGPLYLAEKVRADVAALDHPVPQIEVTGQVVEFNSRDDLDTALGVSVRDGSRLTRFQPDAGDISLRTLEVPPAAFEARLRALKAGGRARLVASPYGTALIGSTASLFVGQQKFVKTTHYDMMQDDWVTEIVAVDVGARLTVRPLMFGDAGVTVRVEPAVSTIAELDPGTGLPTVYTRNAAATMRVRDGDTIIIGGLSMQQTERAHRGIPILRDLPLIGRLFQWPSRAQSHSELAFFATVHIRQALRI